MISAHSYILSGVTFIYALAAVFYIVALIFKTPKAARMGTWITLTAVVGHVVGIIFRWIHSYNMGIGHAPMSNMYESLIFFSLTIAIIYLVLEFQYKVYAIGAVATPLSFLSMAYAALGSNTITPLMPALKSNWLIAHVMTCFLGYAAFAIAFGISFMYLFKEDAQKGPNPVLAYLPEADVLNELIYQMVIFGFLFLTAGIITGAVWAHSAWGRYWGWDPKETWSLITWFIYAALLHLRLMRGWDGKRIAVISIIGFIAVMFTYFGVNYLPGLHSYAKG